MPNIRDLTKLFETLAARDIPAAEQAAVTIISNERRKGNSGAAQTLNSALYGRSIQGHRAAEPLTGILKGSTFLSSALNQRKGGPDLASVMLRSQTRVALQEIIKEATNKDLLSSKGIRRRSKLIFVGPPGCGKSLTAQAIANELHLPFFVIRFDAVIGPYLGQTANRLRELFEFAATTPSVLLFDEIDALGKQRGSGQDVGELDRIVIAIMQELEFFSSPGLLIATSNLPKSLDAALWRRFDAVFKFPKPTAMELKSYALKLACRFQVKLDKSHSVAIEKVVSYADAEKLVESVARKAVLEEL
jgi:hypothetical protein